MEPLRRLRGMPVWLMTTTALVVVLSACGTPAPTTDGTAPASQPPPSSAPQTPGEIPAPAQRPPSPAGNSAPPSPAAAPSTTPAVTEEPPAPAPSTAPAPPPEAEELSDPSSILVVVNKQRPLDPLDFFPSGLVLPAVPLAVAEPNALLRADTSAAVEQLFAAAADDGVGLTLVSGYRSYQDQVATYQHWVAQYGGNAAEADRISARAGYSEHQTGLAFDVGQADGACTLSSCFADTVAGQWMAENAHAFGFILRYPIGAQGVTGFSGEPWHYRYVGLEAAQAMRENGVATLEEFFGLPPAPGY
ncbi:D-alanyl-D-alanine carboxypeptidase [Arthrobacter pigmenti]|uniref:D-alanyl-D-alanine carboxypeptidase n=1 Tax=Arthrobacter pigmenti TaxID=271432 RepID=A0A846RSH2_9MICC|nr:M15 family metallopeptidase [Arthrobacter pigmenti]NJC23117.1 D-alanyl-D-alanine carboxypeptidase [Arthrobacter pigmenti]